MKEREGVCVCCSYSLMISMQGMTLGPLWTFESWFRCSYEACRNVRYENMIWMGSEYNDLLHFVLIYTGGVKVRVHGAVRLSISRILPYFHTPRENKVFTGA